MFPCDSNDLESESTKTGISKICLYMSMDTGLSDCIVELAIVFDLVEL